MAKPIKDEYVELGKRIKQARLQVNRSQDDLRALTGISKQALSAWERGQAPPTLGNLAKFALAVGVTVEELLSGTTAELTDRSSVSLRLDAGQSFVPLYRPHMGVEVLMGRVTRAESNPEKYVSTITKHSDDAIAIHIRDKSMEPRFRVGDIVTLEPLVEPEPGNLVFAFASGSPVFRRFMPVRHGDSNGARLCATNEAYPEIAMAAGDAVLGVMKEHISFHHD